MTKPSSSGSSHSPSSKRRKERANVLYRLRGVFLECLDISPDALKIINISENGLGIEPALIKTPPQLHKTLPGKLIVGNVAAPLQLKLVRITPAVAGFEFVNLPEILRNGLQVIFESELVGANLQLVSRSTNTLQYEDKIGNQLCISLSPQAKVMKVSISILGNQVHWEKEQGFQLLQNEISSPISDGLRKQLTQFIQSVATIDMKYRKQIENLLKFLPIDAS